MSSAPPCEKLDVGSCLSSRSSKFVVQSFLGQGTFGKVAACTKVGDNQKVAIKVMKRNLDREAKEEVLALKKLRMLDSDKCNIVQFYESFIDRQHICLVFEQLDQNLYDFMRTRTTRHINLKEIRPIVQQVANALDHLKTIGTIHADLKLENVMLVNHKSQPYRVKLIDFGLAYDVSAAVLGSYIQTRQYRSPEILLGLPFTEAIDMWSLGCLAATLYLGTFLYPGRSEYDMMRYIVETQGQPPDHLLSLGCKTKHYFNKFQNSKTSLWKLKSPKQYENETGIMQTAPRVRMSLDKLLHIRQINEKNHADRVAKMTDVVNFVSLLKEMLHIDPARRITPRQVMQHNFISMDHLAGLYSESSYVKSCFAFMAVSQKNLGPDSGKGVHRPLQTPSPTPPPPPPPSPTTPPPPVDRDLSQARFIKPHPCTSTLNTSAVKSGKRKLGNEDGTMDETSHLSKRFKSPREEYSGPSTSSRSHGQAKYIPGSTDVRGNLVKPSHPKQPGQCCIRPGMKRKIPDGEDDVDCQNRNLDKKRKTFRRSDLSPPHSIKPHHCTSTLNTSAVKSGMKRKLDNEDGTMDETSHPSNRFKRQREEYPGPSTSSRSHDQAKYIVASTDVRGERRGQRGGSHADPELSDSKKKRKERR